MIIIHRPAGLWPFTELVLDAIGDIGFHVPKIEPHDPTDIESSDFIWGELTPHLELSEGEYLRISQEAGDYFADLGTRCCAGGDPTFGSIGFLKPTQENAQLVAAEFIEYFARQDMEL